MGVLNSYNVYLKSESFIRQSKIREVLEVMV